MKKPVALLSVIVFAVSNCLAQPNGGFENWSTVSTYQTPDSWQTLNFLSIFSNPISAFKATGVDIHSGSYALKIKTIFVNNNPAPNAIDDTVGLIFTGKIYLNPPSYRYGFPYTGRPEKLEFWSKYIPVGTDTGGARVVLRKWNGTGNDTIAFGEMQIASTEAYTHMKINLTYYSTEMPDSAAIIFASSENGDNARVGSTIYLDDVAFTGYVGIDEPNYYADKVKIFPNPATDALNILAKIEEANNVKISDTSGKQIGIYKIQNFSTKVNTSLFAAGIYFYEICDKKDRVLTKGKFNVIK